ncbi:cold-shock protein [Sphingomicrobium sediminis]|uniref:Cold-shock protein n=1 Tax=Sphingomicrobium sediminis TaxID=2950949 RepID=A0A9X2EI59_9SPHN|nr:cold-shock protein [Sphingomicrobium sediminis]MCM8557992.1 cold-shock protein [Sphingomicrobium sediminis]
MANSGTVKFFNNDKGFGFITPDNGGGDAFVHISAVQAAGIQGLREGDRLNYEMETGRNGKESACNLSMAD